MEGFKNRPIQNNYPFIIVDATYFKVRENHRVISKAMMIAMGINEKGNKEIIGFDVYHNESKDTWTQFLNSLKTRRLKDVDMFISDAHEGILRAISNVFPDVPWQRCQYHFAKNITDKVPKKYQKGFRSELQEIFNSKDLKEAYAKREALIDDYRDIAESAIECLETGFDAAMTIMYLPYELRKYIRTSNYLERVNKELKRRSKVIGIFPNEESVLRLMGSLLIELHNKMINKRPPLTATSIHQFKNDHILKQQLKKLAIEQKNLLVA